MGIWGADIFEDDLAVDIRDEFEEYLDEGLSIAAATKKILKAYEDILEDEDDDEGPIVYLALAALHLEEGEIVPMVRNKALKIIENELGLERWEEAGLLGERKEVLEDLREGLLTLDS